MTTETPEANSKRSKSWSSADALGVILFASLSALGIFLAYKTWVNFGGFHGILAFTGRALLQFGLVIATFAAYVVCFFFVHLIISIVIGTRLRRIRIFISFMHDYEPIVMEIEKALEGPAIHVIRLPFRRGRDHNDVIKESLGAVDSADAVVVVPGAEPSWMANELGHAVGSHKPIVVIKHLSDQPLSASLYSGYPVFAWDKIRNDFRPLRRFLIFASRSRADVWPQFLRSLAGFGGMAASALVIWWMVSAVASETGKLVFAFAAPDKAEVFITWYLRGTFVLFAVVFAVSFASVLASRIRGLAVARQKILTRDATYSEFQQVSSMPTAKSSEPSRRNLSNRGIGIVTGRLP
jgi:hypothetical protein